MCPDKTRLTWESVKSSSARAPVVATSTAYPASSRIPLRRRSNSSSSSTQRIDDFDDSLGRAPNRHLCAVLEDTAVHCDLFNPARKYGKHCIAFRAGIHEGYASNLAASFA